MRTHPKPEEVARREICRVPSIGLVGLLSLAGFSFCALLPAALHAADLASLKERKIQLLAAVEKETKAGMFRLSVDYLDKDLKQMETEAAGLQAASPSAEVEVFIKELEGLRVALVPGECKIPADVKAVMFTKEKIHWNDYYALVDALENAVDPAKDTNPVFRASRKSLEDFAFFQSKGVKYDGWKCDGKFQWLGAGTDLTGEEVLALWRSYNERELAAANQKELKQMSRRLEGIKAGFLEKKKGSQVTAEELDKLFENMNERGVLSLAQADPAAFREMMGGMKDVLAKLPQESQAVFGKSLAAFDKSLASLAADPNPQLQAIMKQLSAPPPVDGGGRGAPSGNLFVDFREMAGLVLSGKKKEVDLARTMEWLTYSSQKRDNQARRVQTAWALLIDVKLHEGPLESWQGRLMAGREEARKTAGVEARERALKYWLEEVDRAVDSGDHALLVRYREIRKGMQDETDPQKLGEAQQGLARIFRDRPSIERYYSARYAGEGMDAVAQARGLGAYAPEIPVPDVVLEARKDLGTGRLFIPELRPADDKSFPGGSGAGMFLRESMVKTVAELKEGLTGERFGMLHTDLWDKFLKENRERLETDARYDDIKAKSDYGTLDPSFEQLKAVIQVVRKAENSLDPDEVEGFVRLAAGRLGMNDEQTALAVAHMLSELHRKLERGYVYQGDKKVPIESTAGEKEEALRKARWRAVSAKIDALLKHSEVVGWLNTKEERERWDQFRSSFGDDFMMLTSGMKEGQIKADFFAMEDGDPQAFYLLTERLSHLRGSHRWDLLLTGYDDRKSRDRLEAGIEGAIAALVERGLPKSSPGLPDSVRTTKLALLSSLAKAFPALGRSAQKSVLAYQEDASVRGSLQGMDKIAEKYLSGTEAGREQLKELERLRLKALEGGGFSERSQATLAYFGALEKAIKDSPAFAEVRKLETEMGVAEIEFAARMKVLQENIAQSPLMKQWQEKIKTLGPGASEQDAFDALADLMDEAAVKEHFGALAALVQEHRRKKTELAEKLVAELDKNSEAGKVLANEAEFQKYIAAYVTSGDAPPGAWQLDSAQGPMKVETAEKDGKPITIAVGEDSPMLLRRYDFGNKGPIKGYRVTVADGEELRSFDGKVVVKYRKQGDITSAQYFINGMPAGTVQESPDPEDPQKRTQIVAHAIPGTDNIQEIRTGEVENDYATIRMDDVMAVADMGEFEKALRARVKEISRYMKRSRYLSDLSPGYAAPEEWDSRVNMSAVELRIDKDNPGYLRGEDQDHIYLFLAHRIHRAKRGGGALAVRVQKPGDGGAVGAKIVVTETDEHGSVEVFTADLNSWGMPSMSGRWDKKWDPRFEIQAVRQGAGGGFNGWHLAYREADPKKHPGEAGVKWVVADSFDEYRSYEVYPFVATDNRTGETVTSDDVVNVAPWEAFATHYGYQEKTMIFGLDEYGREINPNKKGQGASDRAANDGPSRIKGAGEIFAIDELHSFSGKFRKDTMVDHFGKSLVTESGKSVFKFGESIWYGAVGSGKILVSPVLGDSYYIEGMANFSENPLSQVSDHYAGWLGGDHSFSNYDPDRWKKRAYDMTKSDARGKEWVRNNGDYSFDAFTRSADAAQTLYDMGAAQDNFFAKSGLYAAGAFIDFGKGTVESFPLMMAGHFTTGVMRTIGLSKHAVAGGQLVNRGMGYYFMFEAGRAVYHMPQQFAEFYENPNDPNKARAFISGSSGLILNVLAAKMMRGPHGGKAAAADAAPPRGLGKLWNKMKFIEGTGMEISPDARNVWGMDMSQYQGGPKRTPVQNTRVLIAERILAAQKKGAGGPNAETVNLTPKQLKALDGLDVLLPDGPLDAAAVLKIETQIARSLEKAGFKPQEIALLKESGLIPEPRVVSAPVAGPTLGGTKKGAGGADVFEFQSQTVGEVALLDPGSGRPTQMSLGYENVRTQLELARQKAVKAYPDLPPKEALAKYLKEKVMPEGVGGAEAWIDPEGNVHLTDQHHRTMITQMAMKELAGLPRELLPQIKIKITKDFRGRPKTPETWREFYREMNAAGKGEFPPKMRRDMDARVAELKKRGHADPEGQALYELYQKLPKDFSVIADNPMRSALGTAFFEGLIEADFYADYMQFKVENWLAEPGKGQPARTLEYYVEKVNKRLAAEHAASGKSGKPPAVEASGIRFEAHPEVLLEIRKDIITNEAFNSIMGDVKLRNPKLAQVIRETLHNAAELTRAESFLRDNGITHEAINTAKAKGDYSVLELEVLKASEHASPSQKKAMESALKKFQERMAQGKVVKKKGEAIMAEK